MLEQNYVGTEFDIQGFVRSWKEEHRFVGITKGNASWVLMTSLNRSSKEIGCLYEKRFGIEKCFQDQKSSGFDIEKSKIRKYDRFKRLLYLVCLAQIFTVTLGDLLNEKYYPIKKKYLIHTALILAFLNLDKELLSHFLKFLFTLSNFSF